MKYVICDNQNVAIFSEVSTHSEIKGKMYGKTTGAGFVKFVHGKAYCYGQSISLNIPSNGVIDSDIINRELNL
jgi:hypothetical protein